MSFPYIIQNTDYNLPHASWHNSRFARSLRWQAFTRLVDHAVDVLGVARDDDKVKMYECPSVLGMHDPQYETSVKHGVKIYPKLTYAKRASRSDTFQDDNEVVFTAIINLSYDRTLRSSWTPTADDPLVELAPGGIYIYERRPAGGDKNRRLLPMKHPGSAELIADASPFLYMQCSLVVVKDISKATNEISVTRWAIENGNILQIAGVFRNILHKGAQTPTDRGEYTRFMTHPRMLIESEAVYHSFRDNRIFLQRAAVYNNFNLPFVIARPRPSQEEQRNPFERSAVEPEGERVAFPYQTESAYTEKAYQSFDVQRKAFETSEAIKKACCEAQTPLKTDDPMYVAAATPAEFAQEVRGKYKLQPQFLYPVCLPPTRSFFALREFRNDYDEAILQDLLTVSEYEIARMMGATRLKSDTYQKRTPEAFKKISQALK
jgi:hypothetical protein